MLLMLFCYSLHVIQSEPIFLGVGVASSLYGCNKNVTFDYIPEHHSILTFLDRIAIFKQSYSGYIISNGKGLI